MLYRLLFWVLEEKGVGFQIWISVLPLLCRGRCHSSNYPVIITFTVKQDKCTSSIQAHPAHQTQAEKLTNLPAASSCLCSSWPTASSSAWRSQKKQIIHQFYNIRCKKSNQVKFMQNNLEFCNPFQLGLLTSLRQRKCCNQHIKLQKEQPEISFCTKQPSYYSACRMDRKPTAENLRSKSLQPKSKLDIARQSKSQTLILKKLIDYSRFLQSQQGSFRFSS